MADVSKSKSSVLSTCGGQALLDPSDTAILLLDHTGVDEWPSYARSRPEWLQSGGDSHRRIKSRSTRLGKSRVNCMAAKPAQRFLQSSSPGI
jgi:hypothetical protein